MRTARWRHGLFALAFGVLAMPAGSQEGARTHAALIATVEAAVPAAIERHDVPGAAVAMVLGGDLVWEAGFGIADTGTQAPVTPDTVFEAASVAKPVTAWAILRLAEQGLLDLDAPIETFISHWSLPPSPFDHSGVTARRLLAHAAGINFGGDPGVEPGEDVPTLREAADGTGLEGGRIEAAFPPAERYRYSSKGYALLEMAVEDITGAPFAEYMQAQILEPLEMTSSGFEWTPELRDRAATGHDWFGNPLPHYEHPTSAPGGLLTTAGDLARFLAAGMTGPSGEPPGRGIISTPSVIETFSPFPFTDDESMVGLGYNLDSSTGTLVARKSGDHRGFKPIVFTIPELGAALVILTNSDRAAAGVFADIACPWSRLLQGNPLSTTCSQLFMIRNAHWGIAAFLVATGLWVGTRPVVECLKGTRALVTSVRSWRGLAVLFLSLFLIAWWGFWYTDIPLRLLSYPPTFYTVRFDPWPTAFVWISWGITVLVIALMLRTALRQGPTLQDAG
ncbi:serine hydrolase [Rhodobacterales bacterium HKCCE3408]|nr:serine hydrolase [Rhodobacterales bacterium HKCCE3408]